MGLDIPIFGTARKSRLHGKLQGRRRGIPFWGPELEGLQHKTVLARFNIEEPYLLSVRAEGVEPFVVKAKVMDATTADKEQLAQVARDRASWARHGKVIFDTLPHPFRFTIAKDQEHSEEVREYGATYDHKLGEAKAEVAEKEKSRRSVQRAATAAGVEPRLTERHPGRVSKALQMRQRAELLRAAEGEIKITED